MSLRITLQVEGLDDGLFTELRDGLQDRTELNAAIATRTEQFIKARGAATAATEHATANRLGAAPTGHLADAYQAVEGVWDANDATLLFPRASRLRAAFGAYTVKPGAGKKYLTIPANAAAYGRRAGEFRDLFFMRVGVTGTPVLARRVEGGESQELRSRTGQRRAARRFTQAEVMYVLAEKAEIPEDRSLIPFAELENEAQRAAEEFVLDAVERSLAP